MEPAFASSAASDRFSVRHQQGDQSVVEEPAGEPAEQPFAQTAAAFLFAAGVGRPERLMLVPLMLLLPVFDPCRQYAHQRT